MIDLLHMHGTEAIKHGANGQKTTEVQLNTSGDLYEEPDNSEQASKLVAFLTAFLDSQVGICLIYDNVNLEKKVWLTEWH